MPLQNRVLPSGDLVASPERGLLMGNRGCLHDSDGRIVRQFQGKRWIICRLDFRGRKKEPMPPGRYTSLFFLDEATALAAGHRPCAECRRARFDEFRRSWGAAQKTAPPSADRMDERLHAERRGRRPRVQVSDLPDGAMIASGGAAYLVSGADLLRWTLAGYESKTPRPPLLEAELLTPPATVAVLRQGYQPLLHPTAH